VRSEFETDLMTGRLKIKPQRNERMIRRKRRSDLIDVVSWKRILEPKRGWSHENILALL
jgi:hypothetical protein